MNHRLSALRLIFDVAGFALIGANLAAAKLLAGGVQTLAIVLICFALMWLGAVCVRAAP